MLQRMAGLVAAVLAGLLLAVPAADAAQARRIVAVGDLHGDWDAWRAIARAAGLIDGNDRWRGGRTVLVQIGDVVDRGPDSLKIIRHLQSLQKQAPQSGGEVVVLVGNHEAMIMTGDLRYVHPGEYAAFATRESEGLRSRVFRQNQVAIERVYRSERPALTSEAIREAWLAATPLGKIEHQAAWSPLGPLGRWTLRNPAVLKLGDTVFVHGGLSAEMAALGIDEVNRRVRAALRSQAEDPEAIINHPLGPLWYRGHVMREPVSTERPAAAAPGVPAPPAPSRPGIAEELDRVLQLAGARRLVIGHTPSRSGIIIDHGGRLVRIDSAISRAYGGPLSWLVIEGDRVTPHTTARPPLPQGGR